MLNAVVMLKVDFARVNEIAQTLTALQEISEVYSVGGRYDLVAIIRVQTNEQLAAIVTEKMAKIQGITSSETMIAFKVYSRHDLEHMFSIGMEKKH